MEEQVKAMQNRIESFFATRSKLPRSCSSNSQCNAQFANVDKALYFLASALANSVVAKKIHSYGVAIRRPTSVLTSRCCSCGNGQNNYTSRNAVRNSMEKMLKDWLSAAQKATKSGQSSENSEIEEKFELLKPQTVSKKYLK